MRHRTLALALLCALSVSPAFADEPAAEAAKVKWVMPWKAGTSLDYATEQLTTTDKAGAKSRERGTDTTHVRITEATADGYTQSWTSEGARFDVLEGDKSGEVQKRTALAALSGAAIDIRLNAEGQYVGMRNADAIATRLRNAMKPLMLLGTEAQLASIEDTRQREAARVEARRKLDGALDRMLAPAIVEAMLTRQIQDYNGFIGIELEPDQAYELETELPNPTGGPAFPAKLMFSLSVSKDDPEDLFVTWDMAVDPEKAATAALQIGEALAGEKIDNTGKDAIKTVDITDEGIIVVHRPTGVLEMFESTRTTKMTGLVKVERSRMRLTNGEHAHTWRDEEEATTAAD
jgi:hypothetical protein